MRSASAVKNRKGIDMAELHKQHDRADWLTWAIEFMRRGLWLDEEITVHGPHDSTNRMWGDATARIDGKEWGPDCSFQAVANRIYIWNADDKDERFPVLKASELTPKAQRWLRIARRMLRKLRSELIAAERNRSR